MSAPLGPVVAADLAGVAVVMAAAARWSHRARRFAVVDAAWGAAFAAAAVAAGAVSLASGGAWRVVLTAALVVVWAARLAWHLGRRVVSSDHDDPRYEELLGGTFDTVPFSRVLLKVFLLQAVAVAVVSLPLIAGEASDTCWGWAAVPGVALWLLGLVFEAVGDAQLAAYRADPERPPILATGLWAWTRHPNYFGDACVWWGVWLVGGVASGPLVALASVPGPLVMTWFLTVVSGARLADRRMRGRPGWAAYEARTPMFVPRPPRGKPLGPA